MTAPYLDKWPGTMTDRERFNRQMHFQSVDRSFNMEFGYWDEVFDLWPLFTENGIRGHAEGHRFFGMDRIGGIGEPAGCWIHPGFPKDVVAETETTQTVRNADGLLAEMPRDGHSSIPHYTTPTVVTPDDWKRTKAERFRLDDPARVPDVDALKKQHPADRDYPLGVNCGSMIGKIRNMLTFEGLAYAVYDYPEMVEDMVETMCGLVEQFLDRVLPHFDFDYASGWEDICFKNGPIVSVDFFRDVVTPRYQRIGDKLHAAGIDLWYTDCDGDVRPIMSCFLDGGINCLFPFEVNGCSHPGEMLDAYPGQLRIMGGVDKTKMAKGGDALKAYMESLVPYVERGGFIPFCDHRCPPDVSQENYLYYLELKREMFGKL